MDERVEDLEKLARRLAPLPAEVKQLSQRLGTVESQIVQQRTEMSDGFLAIRREMKDGLEQVRTELREDIAGLGRDTAQGFLRVGEEMRTLFEEYVGRREVIAEGHPTVDEPPSGA